MASKNRFEQPQCGYTVKGPRIRSDGSIMNKISGTMVGGILGLSPWSTPFSVACDLLGLGRQDVSAKPAVKTGKVLESKIIEYLDDMYPETGKFVPASEMYGPREGPHNSWEPDYIDDVFTGHIDGAVMKDNGETYILEVKTTSNISAWMNDIPPVYYWQVALYNHFLTRQDVAYIAVGLVDSETHKNPDAWVPSQSNVVLLEIDIDQDECEKKLAELRQWYDELKSTHTTPPYDSTKVSVDVPLYAHLMDIASDEDSMRSLVDEVGLLDMKISDKMCDVSALMSQRDSLKAKLKDYLESNNIPEMPSTTGDYRAVMGVQKRRRISPELLKSAGIDPEPFTETISTNTFVIKKKMDKEE